MTLERASEIVQSLRENNIDHAQDLFAHFVNYFDLTDENIKYFAVLCGYPLISNAEVQ